MSADIEDLPKADVAGSLSYEICVRTTVIMWKHERKTWNDGHILYVWYMTSIRIPEHGW
jgi:hypothetical protein